MGRLILVEGIPGSGKTTISKRIADFLAEIKKTNYYEEGAAHPADLAWCACIPKDRLQGVKEEFPSYKMQLDQYGYEEEGYVIVPYTRFPIEDQAFFQKMESFEVYDNRVGFDTFVELHNKKWIRFGNQAKAVDEFTVFECAYLQNHINELLLFHCREQQEIEEYLLRLITAVKDLKPIMFYLKQEDVSKTLQRVSDLRVDENGEKVWRDRVIEYIENSAYGRMLGLKGFDGMVAYFAARQRMELEILKKLPIEVHIIENLNFEWEQSWREINNIIINLR